MSSTEGIPTAQASGETSENQRGGADSLSKHDKSVHARAHFQPPARFLTLNEKKILKGIENEIEAELETGQKLIQSIGIKLRYVNSNRLYRADYKSFEEYVERRWKRSRRWAYDLIQVSTYDEDLAAFLTSEQQRPDTKTQLRTLASLGLEPPEQAAVWTQAQTDTPAGKNPTPADIQRAKAKLFPGQSENAGHAQTPVDPTIQPQPARKPPKTKPTRTTAPRIIDAVEGDRLDNEIKAAQETIVAIRKWRDISGTAAAVDLDITTLFLNPAQHALDTLERKRALLDDRNARAGDATERK